MSLADRLRDLAERLPAGSSLTLTRDGLLNLAASDGGHADDAAARTDLTVAELAAQRVVWHRADLARRPPLRVDSAPAPHQWQPSYTISHAARCRSTLEGRRP